MSNLTLANRIKESRLYPVLLLEDLVSTKTRRFLSLTIPLLSLIFLIVWLRVWWFGFTPTHNNVWLGLALIFASLALALKLIEAFFLSYYFKSVITNDYQPADLFTFTVGRILFHVRDNDLLGAFILSQTGGLILQRLGISKEESFSFLQSLKNHRTDNLALKSLVLAGVKPLTLLQFADWLYANDGDFAKFLFRHQVNSQDLTEAVNWVVREIEQEARETRWWSRERLERVAGLAKDWSHGQTPTLDLYSQDLRSAEQANHFIQTVGVRRDDSLRLENILLKSMEANALLVGPPGEAKMDLIWQLTNEIKNGQAHPALEFRRPVLLHVALLLAAAKDREEFELLILKVFNEAVRAGNIILVIDNLPVLLTGAKKFGTDLSALVGRYLTSPNLPIIALADTTLMEQALGEWNDFLRRFEQLKVTEVALPHLTSFLEQLAVKLEKENDLFFTFPAIKALVESAGRYFQDETVSDQAVDLIIELVPWAHEQNLKIVNANDVLKFVSGKTKIPLGVVAEPERRVLLNLEDLLRAQVIGQETAISSISRSLRRERAGTRHDNKPIGTFLFLGPTGVGKTETAKALARILFGHEEALLRLDMSEYQSSDALNRLIGSFADNKPGILANLLRQNTYGILLLDEFEKTEKGVLNLFLQILDEGFFSDAFGRRVNARNLVLIATSNAGAELIWQMVKTGRNPVDSRAELIDALVQKSVFRPELLNRFDEVVIFRPLAEDELKQVARLLLRRLARRLREQGIELKLSDDLIKQVVEKGSDQLFGARPMARFIQDRVEQVVADKIISGQLRSGSSVRFVGERLLIE